MFFFLQSTIIVMALPCNNTETLKKKDLCRLNILCDGLHN